MTALDDGDLLVVMVVAPITIMTAIFLDYDGCRCVVGTEKETMARAAGQRQS